MDEYGGWLASIMSTSFDMHYRLSNLSSELGYLQADNNVGLTGTGESITGTEHCTYVDVHSFGGVMRHRPKLPVDLSRSFN